MILLDMVLLRTKYVQKDVTGIDRYFWQFGFACAKAFWNIGIVSAHSQRKHDNNNISLIKNLLNEYIKHYQTHNEIQQHNNTILQFFDVAGPHRVPSISPWSYPV